MARGKVLSKRSFEHVSSVTIIIFQELFKTSSIHFPDVFARRIKDMFAKCHQDVLKTSWKIKKFYAEYVLKTY